MYPARLDAIRRGKARLQNSSCKGRPRLAKSHVRWGVNSRGYVRRRKCGRPARSTHIGVRRKDAINLEEYARYIVGRSLWDQAGERDPRDRRMLRKDEVIA